MLGIDLKAGFQQGFRDMVHFRQKIRWAAEDRGIRALYHFTRGENLSSILANGLLSEADLEKTDIDYYATDDARWDDTPQAISFSIDSINFPMFRSKSKARRLSWVILEVNREVLWTHSCRFCQFNASSSVMRNKGSFLGGPYGFNSMFEDENVYVAEEKEYRSRRDHYQIPNNLPTWDDAEVQVLEPVEKSLITAIIVRDERKKNWAKNIVQQLDLACEVEIQDDLGL